MRPSKKKRIQQLEELEKKYEKKESVRHRREMEKEVASLSGQDKRTVRDSYDNEKGIARLKQQRKRRAGTILLVVLLGLVALWILSMVLFKVGEIRITGSTHYTDAELLENCGVKTGSSMVTASANQVENTLAARYPYIESVTVERQWPDTLILEITEYTPAYVITVEEDTTQVLLSAGLKILEVLPESTQPTEVCRLTGVYCTNPAPGEQLAISGETDMETLRALLDALEENRYTQLDEIDLTEPTEISVFVEDRLEIQLGSASQLEYKLQFAKKLIDEEIEKNATGIIDVRSADSKKASFRQNAVVVEPAEDESGENTTEGEETSSGEEMAADGETETGEETEEEKLPENSRRDEADYDPDTERPYNGW